MLGSGRAGEGRGAEERRQRGGLCRCKARRGAGAEICWKQPGADTWLPESRAAIPPFGWLPLTLLLSYKYASPASASILAPTHSRRRTESACSEEKPSPASDELLGFLLPSSSGLAEDECPPLPHAIPAAPGAPSGGQEHRGKRLCRSRRLKLPQLRCSKNRRGHQLLRGIATTYLRARSLTLVPATFAP